MEKFGVGQAVRRREDERFLKGAGSFVDDLQLPGTVHAVVVRSPFAHARILSVDTSDAGNAPGVLRVLTLADCEEAGIGSMPAMTQLDGIDQDSVNHPPRYPFAQGAVRYVGEPVAFVVAESRAQALDAAELVMVDYEDLPVTTDLARALEADTPLVWPDSGTNRAFHFERGDAEATERALASAAHRVTLDLVNNRVAACAMETRGVIGVHDADEDHYTLHTSGQGVHNQKAQLAGAIFKVEPEQMRVVAADVGGGFGSKNFLYPEIVLVLLASKLVGRPVKWIAERSESFISEVHGRDQVSRVELGLDGDGRFQALKVSSVANMGAYLSTMAPVVPTSASWVSMGGTYKIPHIFMQVDAAYTNTMPVDAYRGAGRPEAAYMLERIVDVAALELGLDGAELRRRNFVDTHPYEMPLGLTIDCGDFAGTFGLASREAEFDGFAQRREQSRKKGKLRGIGIASYLEVTLGQPAEAAELRFDSDGGVTLLIGTHATGQGHDTAYSQILHDRLGLPFELIRCVYGDTDKVAAGGGHGGSRSLMIGGSAVVSCANGVRENGQRAAAHILDAAPEDIEFGDGLFAVRGTNRRIALMELEQALRDADDLPEDVPATLGATGRFERDKHSFPNGCHIAEVEIDPETGMVSLERFSVADDFGKIVNPLIAAGQARGGIVQGIGQAMLEHVVYDRESGQIFSGSFMDYALPRADNLPDIGLVFNEGAPTATNPLGVKGAGEAGATGAPAAIANAVLDALKELGVRHIDMPLTSEKVWRAIRNAAA